MHDQFQPISDVITLLANQQHGEASVLFNDLLGARISGALAERKTEIAQTLFAPGAAGLSEGTHDDEMEDAKLVKKLVKKDCLAKEESEQLDEISVMRAHSLGRKRFSRGTDFATAAASAKKDPRHWAQSAEQLADTADASFRKSKKAFDYATKKDGLKEESEQLDELSKATLGNYVKKASHQAADKAYEVGYQGGKKSSTGMGDVSGEIRRHRGIRRAVDKLVR